MTAPSPRLAASLVLLRDGRERDLQVLMQVRSNVMSFAAGAIVFPGGCVEDGDIAIAESLAQELAPDLDEQGKTDLALKIAAIRESFEECGVLFAERRGQELENDEVKALRRGYESGGFGRLLAREGLRPRIGDLQRFAHWITPLGRPKRFDTHFFVARSPKQDLDVASRAEVQELKWLSPGLAASGELARAYKLMFPTRMNLLRLAQSHSVQDVFERIARTQVVTVAPVYVKGADGSVLLRIPPEAGYGGEFFAAEDPPSLP